MAKRKKFALEDLVRNAGRTWAKDRAPGARYGGETPGGEGSGALGMISPKPKGGKSVAKGAIQGKWAHLSTEEWEAKIKKGDI